MRKLSLYCESCGVIATWEGEEDLLHWASESFIEDHWMEHAPSIRYDWDEDDS